MPRNVSQRIMCLTLIGRPDTCLIQPTGISSSISGVSPYNMVVILHTRYLEPPVTVEIRRVMTHGYCKTAFAHTVYMGQIESDHVAIDPPAFRQHHIGAVIIERTHAT